MKDRYRLLETYDMTLGGHRHQADVGHGPVPSDPQEIRRLFCATVNYDMLF